MFKSAADLTPRRNITLGVYGLEKTGKSALCLTFPSPLAYLNLDRDSTHLFAGRTDVLFLDIRCQDVVYDQSAAKGMLATFDMALDAALKDASIKSIVIDGGAQLWNITQDVKLPEASNPHHTFRYSEANEYMRSVFSRVHASGKHFAITGQAAAVYENERDTGKVKMAGFKGVPYMVDVVIQTYKQGGQHLGKIEACGFNTALEGAVLTGPDFKTLYMLVFGEEYKD